MKFNEYHNETYTNGAVGLLGAVTVTGFDDVRPAIGEIDFLQDETVQIAVHFDAGSAAFRHVAYALPPRH